MKPQAKLIYQRVVEERDALLAENQRLRDALQEAWDVIHAARAALSGAKWDSAAVREEDDR